MKKTLFITAVTTLSFSISAATFAGEIETAQRYAAPMVKAEMRDSVRESSASVSGQTGTEYNLALGSNAEVQELGSRDYSSNAEVQELGSRDYSSNAEVQELGSRDYSSNAEVQELGSRDYSSNAEVQELGSRDYSSNAEVQELGSRDYSSNAEI